MTEGTAHNLTLRLGHTLLAIVPHLCARDATVSVRWRWSCGILNTHSAVFALIRRPFVLVMPPGMVIR